MKFKKLLCIWITDKVLFHELRTLSFSEIGKVKQNNPIIAQLNVFLLFIVPYFYTLVSPSFEYLPLGTFTSR